MSTVVAVDELAGDAHTGAGFAHAALKDEIGAKFFADSLRFHGLALVGEGGVARDD